MSGGWNAFTAGMADTLAALPERAVVIVFDAADNQRYVQFKQELEPMRWHAEAVSNEFLPGDQQLTAEQEDRLAAAGWDPPGPSVPNWWCDLPLPATSEEYRSLAEMSTVALRDVLGVAAPGALAYEAFVDGGGPLDLAAHGIDPRAFDGGQNGTPQRTVPGWRTPSDNHTLAVAMLLLKATTALEAESPEAAAAALGLPILESEPWGSVTVDTGLPADGGKGYISKGYQTAVGEVWIPLTDWVKGAEAPAFLRDAFVVAARILTAYYGEPVDRTSGDQPALRWRRRGLTLILERSDHSVDLLVRRTEVDEWMRGIDADMGCS